MLLACGRWRAAAPLGPLLPFTLLPLLACSHGPQEWKPSDYKALKRKVAQLLTVRREREVCGRAAEGGQGRAARSGLAAAPAG